MYKINEKNLRSVKNEINQEKYTVSNMWSHLTIFFLGSAFFIGIAIWNVFAYKNGWYNLAPIWHVLFYGEAGLFAVQLIMILFCWSDNKINQKLLVIGMVVFTYKLALDPFLTMSIFLYYGHVLRFYVLPLSMIIICGAVMHLLLVWNNFNNLNDRNNKTKNRDVSNKTIAFPVIFIFVTIISVIMRNGIGQFDNILGVCIITTLYIGMLIGVYDYLLAAYCIYRFPSYQRSNMNTKSSVKNRKFK
ncbi:hypothetical protein [Heyndrickxia faecalis]|uniref:hypothetical protein n=1 Tax=Heyndrickxia faecalis TaxID=2824910 RepID=UPI003D20A09C